MPVIESIPAHRVVTIKANRLPQGIPTDLHDFAHSTSGNADGRDSLTAINLSTPSSAILKPEVDNICQRVVKVGQARVLRRQDDAMCAGDPTVPVLTIRGQWLERAGFTPGQRVLIEVETRGLRITMMDEV